ncbi:MAG: MBL fold metallo-hydrolase [Bacteroidales bacterium]|nr:MBL fold metallo-hydrolase [Bacteroidales bacterium]
MKSTAMKYVIIIVFLLVLIRPNVLSQTENTHSQDSISITYIANAGFLVEMNDKKIVFDSFFKEGFDKYDYPDSNLIFQMKNNLPPFNNIDYVFVSHYHADHVDPSLLIEHLTNNSHTRLFCPNQVKNILQKDSSKYRIIKEQIITMNPDTNSYEKIKYNDITVTACRLWHGKKENIDIENVGFILEYKNKCIFHSGDATLADFDGLNGYLAACKIDIAILHNSFGNIQFLNKTDSLIDADNNIFMHLTKDYANMFYTFFTKKPNVINNPHIFREAMERKTYFFNN